MRAQTTQTTDYVTRTYKLSTEIFVQPSSSWGRCVIVQSLNIWLAGSNHDANIQTFDLISVLRVSVAHSQQKRSKLIDLICVLETLQLPSQQGFMTFEYAYELYSGYQEALPDKEHFRDEMLNKLYSLPILIFTNPSDGQRFVLLSGNGLDVGPFLSYVGNSSACQSELSIQRFPLSQESVHNVLKSMDTEYDRECARALFNAYKSRSNLFELGMDPDAAVKAVKHVNYVIEENENAQLAATDMLNLRLQARKKKINTRYR